MGQTILFIHSAGEQGSEQGSGPLVDHLKTSLLVDFNVEHPEMPDPENPRYEKWKEAILKIISNIEGPLILIGHSLGGSVLLKFLSEEKLSNSIIALCLIAAPYWGKKEWEIEEFVLETGFEEKIKSIPRIFIYHSQEDKWVPFKHLVQYSKKLPKAMVRAIEGHEHEFYFGLPELIEDIKSITDYGRSI